MDVNNKSEFLKILIGVALTYGKEINDFTIEMFWDVLSGFDWNDVKHAFKDHVGDTEQGRFMPTPADIKKILVGTTEENSWRAWSKVDYALRCRGPYNSLVFDDPIIHHVIRDMGGWIKFSKISDKDYSYLGHEFRKRYEGYKYSKRLDYPNRLIGMAEMSCQQYGSDLPESMLMLIGNADRCKEVYLKGKSDHQLIKDHFQPLRSNLLSIQAKTLKQETEIRV